MPIWRYDMKDVEKTNVERNNSRKRIRRRGRWKSVYGLVVAVLVLTIGVTICYTFLFNINEIRVSGESDMYSAEEIVQASGIEKGDNLLRLRSGEREQMILDKLLYVETAEVDKKFPASLEIKVTKCIPAYNVFYENGWLLVSRNGKILADNGNSTAYESNGLPLIYGYEPKELTAGKMLRSANEHKDEAFSALMSAVRKDESLGVVAVDLSDEFGIVVNYSSGMIFKMGTWSDVEYKLSLAKTVMEDESVKGKKGYLTMVGSNQCRFRVSDEPVSKPENNQESTNPNVSGGDVKPGEQNPDQQAIFDEYNNRNEVTEPNNENGGDQQQNDVPQDYAPENDVPQDNAPDDQQYQDDDGGYDDQYAE